MRKYKIFILILIVIMALFFIFLYFFYDKKEQKNIQIENDKKTEKDKVDLEIYSNDYKLTFQAVVEKNDKYCNHLKDSTIDECLYNIGSVNREVEFCEIISDQILREDCVESIAISMLIDAANLNACENLKINKYKNQCYKEILKIKNDLDDCKNISDEYTDICYDIVHQNIALQKNDISLCDKINDNFYKDNCEISILNKPIDSDGDGISDEDEMIYGTNPFVPDSEILNIGTE